MKRVLYGALAVFSATHLLRDILQQIGINNWFTTAGHSWVGFIADTPRNNFLGMVFFLVLGLWFILLAVRSKK